MMEGMLLTSLIASIAKPLASLAAFIVINFKINILVFYMVHNIILRFVMHVNPSQVVGLYGRTERIEKFELIKWIAMN